MVYGELGRYPLLIDVKTRIISYWARLVTGKDSKIAYILYSFVKLKFAEDSLTLPWLKCVKSILDECGLSYVFNSTDINPIWLKLVVKKTLRDQFIQQWQTTIFESHKCSNYRMFKCIFTQEAYLSILDHKFYWILSKFRTRNSRLPVEYGSWFNVPIEERKYHFCVSEEIVGEFHYIFCCNYFNELRKIYIPSCFRNRPSVHVFYSLFNSKQTSVLRKLCTFITIINETLRSPG